jgi:hypothetical protein
MEQQLVRFDDVRAHRDASDGLGAAVMNAYTVGSRRLPDDRHNPVPTAASTRSRTSSHVSSSARVC